MTITLSCTKCEGGWIRRTKLVPAEVYGTPQIVSVARICPACQGTGKVHVPATTPHDTEEVFEG